MGMGNLKILNVTLKFNLESSKSHKLSFEKIS